MTEFFQENAVKIYWFLGVTLASFLLFILIDKSFKKLVLRAKNKGYNDFSFIRLISRILKIFIVVFLLLFLTFFLVDKSKYEFIVANIKIVSWLAFVAVFTIISITISNTFFKRIIKKKIKEKGNPTSYKFLMYVSVFLIILLGIALAAVSFPGLKGIAQTAVGGAGILAVIIGVASQEALANLIGGFFIILFKPFQLHDVIKISDTMVGEVTDITLRHTIIRNYQNKMIVIPNAIINKEKVINYNLGERKCCQWIEVGISYDSNIDLAKEILKEECESHPNIIDNRSDLDKLNKVHKVITRVIGLDDSAVTLRAWAWAEDYPSAFVLKCDIYEAVKKRFDKEGIEIPFPHRTMVFKESQMTKLTSQIQTG